MVTSFVERENIANRERVLGPCLLFSQRLKKIKRVQMNVADTSKSRQVAKTKKNQKIELDKNSCEKGKCNTAMYKILHHHTN